MSTAQTLELSATLIPCEEGGFTAICNEVRGAITQGETEEEAFMEEGSYQKNFGIEFC